MPGIWLDDDTYQQTAGQIWAQGATQQLHAGEQWAQQALQAAVAPVQQGMGALSRLQSMVPSVPQQTPAPVSAPTPEPTPAPTAAPMPESTPTPETAPISVGQTPTAEPTSPPTAPAQTPSATPIPTPPPEPQPIQVPTPAPAQSPVSAGEDWAQQQIQNLLNPAQQVPQTSTTPTVPPTPTAPPNVPSASATPPPASPPASTPGAPSGPQPSTPGDLIDQARQAATAAGIDPDIFTRQIQQESGFNPNAQSGAGALGIAQFMPATAKGLGVDPMDPQAALKAAAQLDAQNLSKYGGDWSKALAAYNAGGGNVDKYGGVPPFSETQNYVNSILGGAKDLVQQGAQTAQNVIQQGQTAVNTALGAVQSAVARTSQFAMGLSSGDAMAFCGPAAALAFAQTYGRNPTVDEAKQLAQQVGWNPGQGMAGPSSEVGLLKAMGIDAHMTSGVDWQTVGQDAAGGNPVIIDTPGHYYYVDGYNQDTGKFHVGTSGTDLRGGSEWMSADQINAMPQSGGNARAAIFADHPLSGPGRAQMAQGPASSPLTMAGNQPVAQSNVPGVTPTDVAIGLAPFGVGPGLQAGRTLVSSLLNPSASPELQQANTIANAVLNIGNQGLAGAGQIGQAGQDLLGQAQTALGTNPLASQIAQAQVPSIGDVLNQNALVSQGIPSVQGALSAMPDLSAQGIAGAGQAVQDFAYGGPIGAFNQNLAGLGQDILGGVQALPSWSDLARANVPVLSGLAAQPGVLDSMQTIQDLTQKYAGTSGSTAIPMQGQEPLTLGVDPSVMTPEDRDAYRQATMIIGQMAAPPGPNAANLGPVTWADRLRDYHVGNVIGGVGTLSKVAMNAALNPLWSFATRGAADVLGGVTGLAPGLSREEAFGRAGGSVLGAQTGWANAGQAIMDGLSQVYGQPGSIANRATNLGDQVFGRIWETPAALHSAAQTLGQRVLEQIELGRLYGQQAASQGLSGQAFIDHVANGLANPSQDLVDQVTPLAERAVLRGDLGTLGSYFGNMAGQGAPGGTGSTGRQMLGNFLFPVFRVGMNALTQGVEKSPLGLGGTLFDVLRASRGAGPYAGGAFEQPVGRMVAGRLQQPVAPLSERLTNNLAGTAVTAAFVKLALDGSITGNGPSDPGQRTDLQAQGWQPNSIRTPLGYVSYQGTPMEVPLGLAGEYADVVNNPLTPLEQQQPVLSTLGQRLLAQTADMLASRTGLETLGQVSDMLHTAGTDFPTAMRQFGTGMAANMLGSYVPMAQTFRSAELASDPLQRQAAQGDILGAIASRIPGLAEQQPARLDILGRQVANPQQGLGAILPMRLGAGEASPVAAALANAGVSPTATPQVVAYGPTHEVRLSAQERQQWEVYRGNFLQQMAGPLVNSQQFQQMPAKSRQLALEQIDQNASAAANRLMVRDVTPRAMKDWTPTGRLAPVQGYQPLGLGNDQAVMLQQAALHQALMQSLLGGQTGQQALQTANLIANA